MRRGDTRAEALATVALVAGWGSVLLVFVAWLLGGCMLTNQSFRDRQIMRKVSDRVEGVDRYVDIGVVLRVVRLDDNGEITLESGRRVTVVREWPWGGVVDTKAQPPYLCEPSRDPKVWLCSEAQEPIIMHAEDEPLGQLVIGSEGGGKTTALAMWHHRRWVEHIGEYREGLQTAPTLKRLGLVQREFQNLWRSNWCRYVNRDDFGGFELCDGTRIRFVSTHRQSAAAGSPIQGFNSSWGGRDEMQDQLEVHPDIESRGRAAREGRFKQLGTATAKDDPEFRTLRDSLVTGGQWSLSKLLVAESPFVAANFLSIKRASGMTDREFRRRYFAEDLPPENRVYFSWDRTQNVRPVPKIGAKRITSIVLSRKTQNRAHDLLVGHDPGTAKAASVYLDAYEIKGEIDPVWWVRGELFTMHKTSEQHALAVLEHVRARHGCNLGRVVNGQHQGPREVAHVRAQPVGQSNDKPDQDVYRIFARVGLDIRAAQYKKDGTGTGHIAKDSRFEMVNRLLCDANNRRRLFVDCDDLGRPVAPRLVNAFETMERNHSGRGETEEKDEHDLSDVPAALGYALWPFEKESAAALRADIQKGMA